MLRAVLYLALAMVASSAIATELAQHANSSRCGGAAAVATATATQHTVTHETCVATANQR